jgi:ABC-type nitrate/sulfonate/bicarbonate transport system substrate-binding protein
VRRAVLLAAAALALPAAVASGCGDDDSGQGAGTAGKPVKIRMGWGIPAEEIKYVMMRDPRVAPNLGKAYTIDWHQFSGTALGVQGLAAGTLDCASVGGLSVANGIDKGADIVILGEFIEERRPYNTTAWMVRKDSGIKSLADLRGKTVATNAVGGSTDYLQDFYIQQKAGLKPERDYKKVEVPFGQMQETLLSGRIDLGLFPQPFYGAINATGKVKPLFHVTDQIEPFVQILNGCRRDFVEKNKAAMRAFQDDWTRVARWIEDPANRDEVVAISAATTKIPAKVLDKFLLTKQDYFRPPGGALNVAALQDEWNFFNQRGGIKGDLKVTDHVVDGLLPPSG